MILHITEAQPLPGHRLRLRFSNGEHGGVDLSREMEGPVFAPLRDPALFASAQVHELFHTVAWVNGADLAPEYLLDLLHRQSRGTPRVG